MPRFPSGNPLGRAFFLANGWESNAPNAKLKLRRGTDDNEELCEAYSGDAKENARQILESIR